MESTPQFKLNLPKTGFPMRADLVTREPQRLEKWTKDNLYQRIQAARAGAPKFVLHDGPPFANGDVHVGTALNKILKDIIVKYKTLRGFSAPYVPGWDCHGLPIEFKVSQEMRKSSGGAPPPNVAATPPSPVGSSSGLGDGGVTATTIRKACDAYARKYIDIQRTQFKRLGVLGDWENPYLTLNKEYEADELRLFANLVEQGFVYRGKKPVYWSIPCRTALAEAEVEYQDHVSQSCYVKFALKGQPGTSVVIWTTTPWTLPANLAVAFNPKFTYVQVKVGAEHYIIFRGLVSSVAEKCGWSNHEIVGFLEAPDLAKLEYDHPFCASTGKLLPADFVEDSTGTGFVHIAPGHGLDDYNLGRQNGLPIYSPVDDDGKFALTNDLPIEQQMPAEMVGKSILEKHGKSDANEAVLHELRLRHALLHQENYHHSYPHCWRSKTPIIFRAMDQWFIKVDHSTPEFEKQVAEQKDAGSSFSDFTRYKAGKPIGTLRRSALKAIDREVKWIPDWGKNRIEAAVTSRPDWCISRQRTWGVPIPAFCDAQGSDILDAHIVRNVADLIEQHGSNVWFEKSAAELWSLVRPKDWKGAEAAAKSNDTLDVWIDSGSSSRAVLMRRAELQHRSADGSSASSPAISQGADEPSALRWQADMYLEGSDQHRGWFQSSLLLSLAGNGAAPYKAVLTHGFMVDEDRDKISKSKQGQGGYEKPQTADRYVKDYGADVLRLWVASQDYRNDIVVSEERLKKVSETYRGIRNTLRYQLSNLYDFDPAKHTVPDDQLTGLDRWILNEFLKLEAEIMGTWQKVEESADPAKQGAYDRYEFHVVYQKISQFVAVELSSIYHDVVKDRLYTLGHNDPKRRSTQTALYRMVGSLCQILAPILSFTADEAWEFVPGKVGTSVHLTDWMPTGILISSEDASVWQNLLKLRGALLPEIEKARQSKTIGKSLEARMLVKSGDHSPIYGPLTFASSSKADFQELLGVSQFAVEFWSVDPECVIEVERASGQKCERCWHWETDVGADSKFPTICGRCVKAERENAEAENPTEV